MKRFLARENALGCRKTVALLEIAFDFKIELLGDKHNFLRNVEVPLYEQTERASCALSIRTSNPGGDVMSFNPRLNGHCLGTFLIRSGKAQKIDTC